MPSWLRRCQTSGKDSNHCSFTAHEWSPHRRAPQASAVLPGQDIHVPSSNGEGCGQSHPAIESSFRGEAKKFKASGSGDPSYKGRWMLAPNIQRIRSPGELSFANSPPCVLNAAPTTMHNPVWSSTGPYSFFPAVQQQTTNSSGWRSVVEMQAHVTWDAAFTAKLLVIPCTLALALWVHRRRRNHSAKDNPGLQLCHTAWHRTAVNLT